MACPINEANQDGRIRNATNQKVGENSQECRQKVIALVNESKVTVLQEILKRASLGMTQIFQKDPQVVGRSRDKLVRVSVHVCEVWSNAKITVRRHFKYTQNQNV